MPREKTEHTTNKKQKTAAKSPKASEPTFEMIERREYDRLKRRAVGFERNNNRFILVIPCDGNKGWYEMGERSALLYKYEICDKIGVDAAIRSDYDSFYNQYELGRIRTLGVEPVRERLKRAKMYRREQERDKCVIFELNKTYTEDEIATLVEEERRRQTELNNIVRVQLMDPVLMVKMLEVSARLHRVCLRKMDRVSRDTNGQRIVSLCDKMMRQYYQMSATEMDLEAELTMWKALRQDAEELMIELQLIVGLKIWKREQCVKLGEMVIEIEERLNTHIRKTLGKIAKNKKQEK